jgi:hypothetical protein
MNQRQSRSEGTCSDQDFAEVLHLIAPGITVLLALSNLRFVLYLQPCLHVQFVDYLYVNMSPFLRRVQAVVDLSVLFFLALYLRSFLCCDCVFGDEERLIGMLEESDSGDV